MDSLHSKDNRLDSFLASNPDIEETTLEIKERKIREALKSNPIMTDNGFINDVVNLSIEFCGRFSGVNIDEYLERLKTLKLEYFGKYAYPEYAVKYLPNTNIIAVNKDKIMKENIDVKHALMRSLIAMITTKDNDYGFGSYNVFEALNEGFCDMTARALVGDSGNSGFQNEREIVDLIGKRIGVEPFINAFFENDPRVLMNAMRDKCQNPEKLKSLLLQINNNMHTKVEDSDLLPIDIEKQLISMFGKIDTKAMLQPISYKEQTKTR